MQEDDDEEEETLVAWVEDDEAVVKDKGEAEAVAVGKEVEEESEGCLSVSDASEEMMRATEHLYST